MSQSIFKVLVVDDEYLIAMDAERILTDTLPCEVQITSRRFCQEILSQRRFDIILLDIDPFQEDLQVLAGVFQSRKTAVIFSSTHVGFSVKTRLGPHSAIIGKPYHDGQFSEAIAHVLDSGYATSLLAPVRPARSECHEAIFVNRNDRCAVTDQRSIVPNLV